MRRARGPAAKRPRPGAGAAWRGPLVRSLLSPAASEWGASPGDGGRGAGPRADPPPRVLPFHLRGGAAR